MFLFLGALSSHRPVKLTKQRRQQIQVIERWFAKQISKGRDVSVEEIRKYAKNRKFLDLASDEEAMKQIRRSNLPSWRFSRGGARKNRSQEWQTVTLPRLGIISMDLAFFEDSLKRHNAGFEGALVCCDIMTNRRAAIPVKNKSMNTFEDAVEILVKGNLFPEISTLLSDREAAVASAKFRKKIKDDYLIDIFFLRRHSKSYSAEQSIGWLKREISIVLEQTNSLRWIDVVDTIIARWNREKIPGTDFARDEVDESNFLEFMDQLYNLKDSSLSFNSRSIDYKTFLDADWRRELFGGFVVGQRIHVLQKSLLSEKARTFYKTSRKGYFSSKVHVIVAAKLRSTKKNKLIPGAYNNIEIL